MIHCIRTLNSEGENGVAGNGNGDDRAQAGRHARAHVAFAEFGIQGGDGGVISLRGPFP